ncbi:MAG TPA: adenylate/guanylate cyclase domain-containing protein [Candidatus Limnocylindria bacterium]
MTQVVTPAPRDLAMAAFAKHAWREAYERFVEADAAGGLSAADLDMYADAAWWIGETEASLSQRERAYAAFVADGDRLAAASVAIRLADESANRSVMTLAGAWLSRVERLLEGDTSSAIYGALVLRRAYAATAGHDIDAAIALAREALAIGERQGDRDLQALALLHIGAMLVRRGEVKEGMALVDEATIGAVSGDLRLITTGVVYCHTILACRDIGDYQRAGDWTEAAHRWCDRQSVGGFPGICRVNRAEVIALRGALGRAEQEARLACDELLKWEIRPVAGEAFYEIGWIRLRMGDFPAAEEAFRQAHEMGRVPEPGLSLIRLAEGKADVANASLRRVLENERSGPNRSRLLPAQCEAALAAGDRVTARAAVDELDSLAAMFDTVSAHAHAKMARGALLLADGDADAARRTLGEALALWQELDAPYEAARTRMLVADAARASGDEDAWRLELETAKATFERIGARRDARVVAERLGGVAITSGGEPRVTRTFLFTDIVASTSLLSVIGDDAWRDLIAWHDETLRAIVAKHGGEEIRHQGDGLVVAFDDPSEAIECAIAIQRRLADHRKAHGFAPAVRIGVHRAETLQRGLDYAGVGIHEAARVGALAKDGEILVTRATLHLTRSPFATADPRTVTAKGISEPLEVVSVVWR